MNLEQRFTEALNAQRDRIAKRRAEAARIKAEAKRISKETGIPEIIALSYATHPDQLLNLDR